MLLLASLLEHIDRKQLLLLQQKLVESDLSDVGWDFELTASGLIASNPEMPGQVALGPLEYGSCSGDTPGERIDDLIGYYNKAGISTVTAIIHSYSTGSRGTDDMSISTVIFPSSTDAFKAALQYEGSSDPLDLLTLRFDDFVNTLMTAKTHA